MSLGDDYLAYPRRRRGQDIDRYDWAPAPGRPRRSLAGGAKVAVGVIVPLERFMLDPGGRPFRHPGAMQTPYPDLRHYTTRDYGNRVGAFRLLKAFAESGVQATFAVNAVLLDRVRPLIDVIAAAGHEFAAHGLHTDAIHWSGLPEDDERRYVEATRDAFEKAGLSPRACMSPARQQSAATPDLIRAAGFDICLDWEQDIAPTVMRTCAGDLAAFPVLNELDDRFILAQKAHSEDDWRDQIIAAASCMIDRFSVEGAGCFGFTMTPYIAGQPFRMRTVREIVSALAADPRIMTGGVGAIVAAMS